VERGFIQKIHERWVLTKKMDFRQNLLSSFNFHLSFLGRIPAGRKRIRICSDPESSSSSSSEDSSEDESEEDPKPVKKGKTEGNCARPYKIPKLAKHWSPSEIDSFRSLFPALRFLPDSVIEKLTFKEMSSMAAKDGKTKAFTQTLAANFDSLKHHPVEIRGGSDSCVGTVHAARFLRGYVGNPIEIWLQARKHLGINGLDPVTNYDANVTGIAGKISNRVWAEVHNLSSKDLSVRMLSTASMKAARKTREKHADLKDFETLQ
jgi:hypothetical protein